MGIDIYSSSGILFTLDEAVTRFFKGISNSKVKKIVGEIETMVDDDERKSLKAIQSCSELRSWFLKLAGSGVQDDYIQNGDVLNIIWDKIIDHTIYKNLPSVEFEYFTNNRFSGYEVPTNTICAVFDDSGLFETKPTKKGQKVAAIMKIKNLKQTNWTVYSY